MTVFPGSGLPSSGARVGAAAAVAVAVFLALAVARWVDLTPRVDSGFFFAEDDPQLEEDRALRERYRLGDQVILRVRDPSAGPEDPAVERDATLERIEALARALEAVPGVERVYSPATHDAGDPLYRRILAVPDPSAANLLLTVDGSDPGTLVPRLEAVAEAAAGDLEWVLSGAPVIVEQIRRSLFRDLVVFTAAAVLLAALLVLLIYRDAGVLAGMLLASAVAVNGTLLSLRAVDASIGLLTANLATIVFVLTLSHMVFITAAVRRAAAEGLDRPGAVARGARETLEGSFWGMSTTLLGFLSLLVATARPLRELGVAGAVGTVLAMASAYLVYPVVLAAWGRPERAPGRTERADRGSGGSGRRGAPASPRLSPAALAGVAVAVAAVAAGVPRLDTDPGLLSYFAPGSDLRRGLAVIDEDGGSSPLHLAVRDAEGGRLDTEAGYRKLAALQEALEDDPRIGVVLGPSVLIDQARTMPLAGFLPLPVLLDIASSPRLDEVALGFVTRERDEGLFLLRMREGSTGESRDEVVADVRRAAEAGGLEPVAVAGLYELQARLGRLIRESLAVGLGGLLILFLGVAAAAARRPGTVLRMEVCLAAVPLVVLGAFGWLGIAVDVITAPAANVALAVGVDAMLHLVVQVRRGAEGGDPAPWRSAVERVRGPVLAATAILGAGFGVFVLSDFPPTRRFGLAVILGTATAAALALVVLPAWSGRRGPTPAESGGGEGEAAPA